MGSVNIEVSILFFCDLYWCVNVGIDDGLICQVVLGDEVCLWVIFIWCYQLGDLVGGFVVGYFEVVVVSQGIVQFQVVDDFWVEEGVVFFVGQLVDLIIEWVEYVVVGLVDVVAVVE